MQYLKGTGKRNLFVVKARTEQLVQFSFLSSKVSDFLLNKWARNYVNIYRVKIVSVCLLVVLHIAQHAKQVLYPCPKYEL